MDKKIDIEKMTVGPLGSNCYLLINKEQGSCILIDAGDEAEVIKRRIFKFKLTLEAILLTHGHIDHIRALGAFEAPIFIHRQEIKFLKDGDKNLSQFLGFSFSLDSDRDLRPVEDGQILKIAGINLKIIHTPGHTPGSITIQFEDNLFSGDALFAGSIGRTDLSYGSTEQLISSIKNKLLILPAQTKVYPGHGPSTTIGEEKDNNPFLCASNMPPFL